MFGYSSDESNNRTQAVESLLRPDATTYSQSIDFSYDLLSRLETADFSGGSDYHYACDAVGNRLSETTGSGTVSST